MKKIEVFLNTISLFMMFVALTYGYESSQRLFWYPPKFFFLRISHTPLPFILLLVAFFIAVLLRVFMQVWDKKEE